MPTSDDLYWAATQVDGSQDMMADLIKVRTAASSHGVVNCALEATVNQAFALIQSLQQGAADQLGDVAELLRKAAANEAAREEAARQEAARQEADGGAGGESGTF